MEHLFEVVYGSADLFETRDSSRLIVHTREKVKLTPWPTVPYCSLQTWISSVIFQCIFHTLLGIYLSVTKAGKENCTDVFLKLNLILWPNLSLFCYTISCSSIGIETDTLWETVILFINSFHNTHGQNFKVKPGDRSGSVFLLASSSSNLHLALEHFAAEREVAGTRISTLASETMVLIWKKVGLSYSLKWRSLNGYWSI